MTYSVPKDCQTIINEILHDQYINDEKAIQTAVLNDRFTILTGLADSDETKLTYRSTQNASIHWSAISAMPALPCMAKT